MYSAVACGWPMTTISPLRLKPSCLAVLALLREREYVTDAIARAELHQTRLAGRVHELRAAGFVIERTMRDGYAVYRLEAPVGQLEMRLR